MTRRAALLHNAHVELQALISKRCAMWAANVAAESEGKPQPYSEADFEQLAEQMRYTQVDVTEFPS